MPVDETIERAREELAAGDVAAARQRLRGVVGSRPRDIAARELLAETYRRTGDHVQAGRWAYATDTVTGEEIAAFARGFSDDPVQMMRALRWTGSEHDAPSEGIRERLTRLRESAEEKAGRAVAWESPSYPPPRGSPLLAIAGWALAVFLLVSLVVGVVTLVKLVVGWF